jgi:hypothetical protein
MSDVLLKFNGHTHDASKVLGKASRPVEVTYKDINTDMSLVEYQCVPPGSDPLYGGATVFIHFNGKYVPLMGRAKVLTDNSNPERIIKGMLITSVALKAARLETSYVRPSGPTTLPTPSEGIRVSQPEHAPLKNIDALRDRFSSPASKPSPRHHDTERRPSQNYGGTSRPESATGSSLRSRSPYRGTTKRSGV